MVKVDGKDGISSVLLIIVRNSLIHFQYIPMSHENIIWKAIFHPRSIHIHKNINSSVFRQNDNLKTSLSVDWILNAVTCKCKRVL